LATLLPATQAQAETQTYPEAIAQAHQDFTELQPTG
jgi:hypothetical protein